MKKISLIVLALLCQGCMGTSLSRTIGLDTKAPDEFAVTSQKPLVIPSQFILVTPGVENIAKTTAPTNKADKNYSPGENVLLDRASDH